jgi:hypothetical protein
MPRGGSTYRRGGRQKGTPNKQSVPAIKSALLKAEPGLDSIELMRKAAAIVRDEINKALNCGEGKYKPGEVIEWCVKLGRIAEAYIGYEYPRITPIEAPDRGDYNVHVQADLARLNTEQLVALKTLALIASGGNTKTIARSPDPPDRPNDQREASRGGAGQGRAQFRQAPPAANRPRRPA